MLEMINKRKWNNAYIKRLFLNVQLKLIYLHFWNFKNNIYTIWFAVYSQKYKLDISYIFWLFIQLFNSLMWNKHFLIKKNILGSCLFIYQLII